MIGRLILIALFLPLALIVTASTIPNMDRRETILTTVILAIVGLGAGLYISGGAEYLYWKAHAYALPLEQRTFIDRIDAGRGSEVSVDNERLGRICAGTIPVENWQGQVRQILLTNGGRTIFTVQISSHMFLGTSTSLEAKNLIDKNSSLIPAINTISTNQHIWFSGRFVQDGGRCVIESDKQAAATDVDLIFIFQFSEIAASPGATHRAF